MQKKHQDNRSGLGFVVENCQCLGFVTKIQIASVILPLVISFKITYLSPSQTQYLVETEINDEKQKFNAFHKMTWQNKSMKNIQKQPLRSVLKKMYSFLQILSEIKKTS